MSHIRAFIVHKRSVPNGQIQLSTVHGSTQSFYIDLVNVFCGVRSARMAMPPFVRNSPTLSATPRGVQTRACRARRDTRVTTAGVPSARPDTGQTATSVSSYHINNRKQVDITAMHSYCELLIFP